MMDFGVFWAYHGLLFPSTVPEAILKTLLSRARRVLLRRNGAAHKVRAVSKTMTNLTIILEKNQSTPIS